MNEPVLSKIKANDIEMAVFEWHSELRGKSPTVVLAHATGFHARCWDQVIGHLDPCHIIAVDQRGHGRSQSTKLESWHVFGDDLVALMHAMDVRNAIGVGHSMGGHAMVQAAAKDNTLFSQLLLIDPVIMPPERYANPSDTMIGSPEDHPTSRRRSQFNSVEDMVQRFAEREPYSIFQPAAFHDYCEYGLLADAESDDGSLRLACQPIFEASVYMTSLSMPEILDMPAKIDIPVTVLRAMLPPAERDIMTFKYSPTWPDLAASFSQGKDIHREDRTHFMPLEDPTMVAGLINEKLALA